MYLYLGDSLISKNEVMGISIIILLTIAAYIITNRTSRLSEIAKRTTSDNLPLKCLQINSMLENEEIDGNEAKNKILVVQREGKIFDVIYLITGYLKKVGSFLTVILLFLIGIKLSSLDIMHSVVSWCSKHSVILLSVTSSIIVLLLFSSLIIGYLINKNFINKK